MPAVVPLGPPVLNYISYFLLSSTMVIMYAFPFMVMVLGMLYLMGAAFLLGVRDEDPIGFMDCSPKKFVDTFSFLRNTLIALPCLSSFHPPASFGGILIFI